MEPCSRSKLKYILKMRKKYKNVKDAPQDKKWVFNSEWQDKKDLCVKIKNFKSYTESLYTDSIIK